MKLKVLTIFNNLLVPAVNVKLLELLRRSTYIRDHAHSLLGHKPDQGRCRG